MTCYKMVEKAVFIFTSMQHESLFPQSVDIGNVPPWSNMVKNSEIFSNIIQLTLIMYPLLDLA